jgi:putative ABC transport system permease protein
MGMILKELWHRKANTLLSLVGLGGVVAFIVGFMTTAEAAKRETKRITRDLGFNLRIIPKDTDMDRYWFDGFSTATMAEDTVARLAAQDGIFMSYNHLMASLKQPFRMGDREVILMGVAPTITSADKKKRPMGFSIKEGTLQLGFQVADRLGVKPGDKVTLGEQEFLVAKCLVESGTEQDIYAFGTLADIQNVLGLDGQINEIKAIDCLCLTADEEPVKILREELGKVLPEAKVIQDRVQADARAKQRQMVENKFGFLTPFLLVVSALWVGVMAALNLRERRAEIGVLRALGYGSGRIASLFLIKAAMLGILGALVGFALGNALAMSVGPEIFKVTAKAIKTDWNLLGMALVAAPVLAAIATFIPAMQAVAQDPAVTLREE